MNPRETECYTTICFVLMYYYIKTKYTAKETVVHTVEKNNTKKYFQLIVFNINQDYIKNLLI